MLTAIRTGSTPLLLLVLTVEAAGAQIRLSPAIENRVLVQPFVNLSDQPGDAWIGAGIAETVATALAGAGLAAVVWDGDREPRNRRTGTAGTVAERPGFASSVTGAYQRAGDRVRITARVTDALGDTVIGSAVIDGHINELFALQDRLAAELRGALVTTGGTGASTQAAGRAPFTVGPRPVSPPAATTGGDAGFAAAPTIIIDGAPGPVAPETITRDAAGRATVRAVRLTEPLRLDGTLDEGVYAMVLPVGGFIQQLFPEQLPGSKTRLPSHEGAIH